MARYHLLVSVGCRDCANVVYSRTLEAMVLVVHLNLDCSFTHVNILIYLKNKHDWQTKCGHSWACSDEHNCYLHKSTTSCSIWRLSGLFFQNEHKYVCSLTVAKYMTSYNSWSVLLIVWTIKTSILDEIKQLHIWQRLVNVRIIYAELPDFTLDCWILTEQLLLRVSQTWQTSFIDEDFPAC